jgi:formylglycine-generating enzyme required for sulfatase activity
LKQADTYFEKRRFLTPEDQNAYTLYQKVLERDPANRHALEKLRMMITLYKEWGEASYQVENYSKAQMYYQRYSMIAQYMLNDLGIQSLDRELREIETQLRFLEMTSTPEPMPGPTPHATVVETILPEIPPLPYSTPTLRLASTPTFSPEDQGLMEIPPLPPISLQSSGPLSTPTPTPRLVTPTPTLSVPTILSQPPDPTPAPLKTWVDPVAAIEFVWIPPGCFEMGSPQNEEGRDPDEEPLHQVCLKGFWMGKYELTQGQWTQIMGSNPSYFSEQKLDMDSQNYPVEQVSWDDVQKFLRQLNTTAGTNTYRLPSEAEWEYACRAGTDSAYYFGNNVSRLDDYAWYNSNSGGTTHSVGQLLPNTWGLYDMHGNVWEWCEDSWHEDYNGASRDGSAWKSQELRRVLRGGAWNNLAWFLRSADRLRDWGFNRNFTRGVRLVRSAEGP